MIGLGMGHSRSLLVKRLSDDPTGPSLNLKVRLGSLCLERAGKRADQHAGLYRDKAY